MRKGYLLIEMIVVMAIMTMLMVSMDRFFMVFANELPKDSRLLQENIVLLDAVSRIRADVASADAVSQKTDSGGETPLLVIYRPADEIYYEFGKGQIIRRLVELTKGATPQEIKWSLPHGKIETRVLTSKGGAGCTVEIITCIEDYDFGHTRQKLANNYLAFTGSPWEAGK
ncbi:MAG: prepilin-type N-terminal cleavage/methylation domain-containing protein [Sedimentisphaerales bacterium]